MEKFLNNAKVFLMKNQNALNLLLLGFLCYLFLFHNLGKFPLVDIDETRYVNMSRDMLALKDYVTPYLNFEYFLEKPPLYFWLNIISYKIFGSVGIFASRFATAMLGAFSVFFTYIFVLKVMRSKAYALISSCVLLSSSWFLVLSHNAILDMGFMALSMATIYSAILALFVEEKNKKWMWYLGSFFMALSVLMKGLIGIVVPCAVVFFTYLYLKKAREMFKPLYLIPGLIIFLIIALPWHILVWKEHGMLWFNDYIVKHHFARFVDSSLGLGRKQPFFFYVPVILGGLIPWTFNLIGQACSAIKSAVKDVKAVKSIKTLFSADSQDRKMLAFALIYAVVTFVFFSASSSKLPTYALALFPALALMIGYYWWGYICFDKYSKSAKISTLFTSVIFILLGIGALVVMQVMPEAIKPYLVKMETFAQIVSAWFIIIPAITIASVAMKNKAVAFVSNVVFMIGIMMIACLHIFPFITNFGQNELEAYAKQVAQIATQEEVELMTFGFQRKYSLMNDYDKKIIYIITADNEGIEEFKKVTNETNNKKLYLILKNDTLKFFEPQGLFDDYKLLEQKEKYSLLIKN